MSLSIKALISDMRFLETRFCILLYNLNAKNYRRLADYLNEGISFTEY